MTKVISECSPENALWAAEEFINYFKNFSSIEDYLRFAKGEAVSSVGVLGGIPSIGSSSKLNTGKALLKNEPVGVENYYITTTSATLKVKSTILFGLSSLILKLPHFQIFKL